MSDNTLSDRLIFGPSHSVRLRHALATRQLPQLPIPSRIIGVGGMPIWSPNIRKEIAASTSTQDAFFIVGDFRFGNALLKDPAFKPGNPPQKTYLSIEKDLINEENDQILFDVCRSAMTSLDQQLHGKLRLLFWDLSIREYQNRVTGRYQESGVYRHPVWNLADTLKAFSGVAIDTQDILNYGERLYIDSSAHPGLLGWLYILKLLRGDARVDLHATIQTFDQCLKQLLADEWVKDPVLITGDSKFVRSLQFFVQKGHFQLPTRWAIQPLTKAVDSGPFGHCLYFPALCTHELNATELSEGVEKIIHSRQKLAARHKKLSILYYDNWAYESISKRKEFLGKFTSKIPGGLTENLEQTTCPKDQAYKITDSIEFNGMIELNDFLLPTTLGVFEILGRSTSGMNDGHVKAVYNQFLTDCYN